jgi:catechol 2,3-dioxygenase-like lactoylglutathione lyase family enzyme
MVTSIYPVLMSDDVAESAEFFRKLFGFETVFETDWYVSLRRDRWELGIVAAEHGTVPEAFRSRASGLLLNVEVADVDAEYRRLVKEGPLTPVLDIRSEEFGQRHFIVAGPDRVLIDVISEIAPGAEYADSFVADQAAAP